MFQAFIFFLAGIITHKVLQFCLSITPNYNIYKEAEMTALKILGELYVARQTSLKVLKAIYESTDKQEEYFEAEKKIKVHYDTLINNSLLNIKKNLPYKVPYNTLNEAIAYYIQKHNMENKNE